MKTKNILIVGAIIFLGFLFWKNKKKPTTATENNESEEETSTGGGGGGGFMGGAMPLAETPSQIATDTSTGTSIVSPDPLADSTPSVSTPLQTSTYGTSVVTPDPLAIANELANQKSLADAMEAKALASKTASQAQQANNLTQAKAISNTIQININKRNGYKKASSVRGIQTVIDADIARLRALGYTFLPNGGVQPI